MKKLQCELCNSVDIVKIANDMFQCRHCGCKYTAEQARSLISGTVEIVKGDAEKERIIANAETQSKLGDIDGAMEAYQKLQKEYAADYRVWWGWITARLAKINETCELPAKNEMLQMNEYLQRAYTVCGENATLIALKNEWQRYWDAAAKCLIKGKFYFDRIYTDCCGKTLPDYFKCYAALSNGMKEAIDYGYTYAAKLNETGFYFGYSECISEADRWVEDMDYGWLPLNSHSNISGNILFALGRCMIDGNIARHTAGNFYLLKKNITPVDDTQLNRLNSEVQAYIARRAAEGYCGYCDHRLDKNIFGQHCKICGKRY